MLGADLQASADLDLAGLVDGIADVMGGVALDGLGFDAAGVLGLVASLAPPDLQAVTGAVAGVTAGIAGSGALGTALPGAGAAVGDLSALLDALRVPFVLPDAGTDVGLAALSGRVAAVQGALGAGPIPALLDLVPGLDVAAVAPRVGGSAGGLIALLQAMAALSATSSVSARLAERATRLGGLFDAEAAAAAAARLAELAADTATPGRIRAADPEDGPAVQAAGDALVSFQDAVAEVSDAFAQGMGLGEAVLLTLDLDASAAALDVARLALLAADVHAVGALSATVVGALRPVLQASLPDPAAFGGDVVAAGLAQVDAIRAAIEGFDPAVVAAPVRSVVETATAPLTALAGLVETVATEIAAGVRTVRDVVDQVDLAPVAAALRAALQPLVDALAAIEGAVAAAEAELRAVADGIQSALGEVAETVEAAAATVGGALGRVRQLLAEIGLGDLADALAAALTSVGQALSSATLAPYFDAAVDVVDTAATVVDAVPFSMLPTDVQQEVVDACRPIKELQLQPIEDTLRSELAEITDAFQAGALDAVEQAYAEVVDVLAQLDPGPPLVALEEGPLAELRAAVAAVDPRQLLAPVTQALDEARAVLAGVDLEATILDPLEQALGPVRAALAGLDPAALLEPVTAGIDAARTAATELLRLDEADAALDRILETVAGLLARIDVEGLAATLDDAVTAQLGRLPDAPASSPLPALVAATARATGLDAEDAGVVEALAWVGPTGAAVDPAAVVAGRLGGVATAVAATREAVRAADPGPLIAAAGVQWRTLRAAVESHPDGSLLRQVLGPLVAAPGPAGALGPLTENRRRYLAALDAAVTASAAFAASGRAEVSVTAAGVRAGLAPLQAVPERIRAVLTALGLDAADLSPAGLLRQLLRVAGPERVLPALVGLVAAARTAAVGVLQAVLAPLHEGIGSVRGLLAAVDVGPVVAELTALHADVLATVDAFAPRVLLGDAVTAADELVARLAAFDPLAPVADVLDAALTTADEVLETARPTVVFADAIGLHADVMAVAAGLDVRALLEPVITALDGLAAQLDDGFDRTGDALQRLQAALPGEVSDNPASVSAGLSVGIG
jgi:hypothetical protein